MYSLETKTSSSWKATKSGNMNKLNTFNLFETDNEFGFPNVLSDLRVSKGKSLLPFNACRGKKRGDANKIVHFFLDDYQFEPLWSDPRKYIDILSFYDGIISPTFSIWSNQPYALNLFNVYRSRWCTRFFQENGIKVLVDCRWSEKDSYDFAFSGIAKHSPIIVNTVGTKYLENRRMFCEGFEEMLSRIEPSKLYVYGEYKPLDFEYYFGKVTYFESFWKQQRDKINNKKEIIL